MTKVPAIEAIGLHKEYEKVRAVHRLDLTVPAGEIFGLVGADGAGKTSTIRMLATLSKPTSGQARVLGMDTVKEAAGIRPKIGYMSEGFNLYPILTVDENLDFFARLHGVSRDVYQPRKQELLDFCRLEQFRKRHAEHLSGGMQKKLSLACSLIHEPEVIFLDEPTTGVDPVSRRDFWRIITGFLARGITVLVSTPYLDEAERFDRVALMHQGEIIACDSPVNLKKELAGKLLEIRADPLGEALSALKEMPFPTDPQVFGDTIHVLTDGTARRGTEIKELLEKQSIKIKNMRDIAPSLEDFFVNRLAGQGIASAGHRLPVASPGGVIARRSVTETAVEVANLTRKFGDFTAVGGIDFEVKRGEIFGLLGPNGSGKTTTIRMITGLLSPTSGNAWVLGQDMSKEAGAAQSKMGYMSQKFSLFADLTVEENINLYGGLYGLSRSLLGERKKWVLDMAGLRGMERTLTRELSGGWKQRLALGCTIIHGPEVVFLDEPTAGVDPLSRRSFWELILELSARGTAVFITTHYMDEAEHCHRLGLMYQGRLIALESPFRLKTKRVSGELVEIFSADFARALELLSADERYRQVSLFGSAIHVMVDKAETAAPEIRHILENGGVTVHGINHIPFTMEDVFISLVEEQELSLAGQRR